MRHLADQHVARAERVRASARQTFAYLTAIFTVAQAGTLSGFDADELTSLEQSLMLSAALLAVVGIAAAGLLTLKADRLRRAPEIAPRDITSAGDTAHEHGEPVSDELTLLYADRIRAHSELIDERRGPLKHLTWVAGSTIILLVIQIIVALIARLA
jgi:hypothetical protein